jgi:hypothetical protein
MGFSQIDFHGGSAAGDCLPDPVPQGFEPWAAIDRFTRRGSRPASTYAFFIDKRCPWVTGSRSAAPGGCFLHPGETLSPATGSRSRADRTCPRHGLLRGTRRSGWAGCLRRPESPPAFTSCSAPPRARRSPRKARAPPEGASASSPRRGLEALEEWRRRRRGLQRCGFDMMYMDASM